MKLKKQVFSRLFSLLKKKNNCTIYHVNKSHLCLRSQPRIVVHAIPTSIKQCYLAGAKMRIIFNKNEMNCKKSRKKHYIFKELYLFTILYIIGVPIIVGKIQMNKIGGSFNRGILLALTTSVAVTMPIYEPNIPPI
jgi:hypothetical protein